MVTVSLFYEYYLKGKQKCSDKITQGIKNTNLKNL